MLVDSHCHLDRLDLAPFGNDFGRLVAAAADSGVAHMLCVCIDLESYPAMLALVESYPQIYVSVGIHPNDRESREPEPGELEKLASHPRNVAIGETGLDYFRSEGDLGWQQARFRDHIAAARACGKPLIIHTRAAKEDTIAIMTEERARDAGGVMHCFTEDWEMAKKALDLGFYISFSGIITFNSAAELREVARKVPQDRLLIETDAPYLAPVPFRGKPNLPQYVTRVAECIAQLRGVSVEEVAATTSQNFFELFSAA
ncbi:MAG: TatD family hydrolase [Gammaproteobacteria bacterium]|nr:TatD family hydrolase [Gammaproteobacteria bacterium]HXK55617.1 TatD family hydrolase [Gammaproteobacteria bacterium]